MSGDVIGVSVFVVDSVNEAVVVGEDEVESEALVEALSR